MRGIKTSRQDIIFETSSYILLSVVMLIVLYPLYFVVIASFSEPHMVNIGKVILLPKNLMFDGYKKVFGYSQLWIGYRNTIIYTVVGTLLDVAVTMLASYSLSRKKLYGKKIILFYMMFTMYFSGGLIPTFLQMQRLGLYNNWMILVIGGMVNVTNIIICRTYIMNSIPEELNDSAFIDGVDHFGNLTKIVMPLSKPIIAVMVLFFGVAHWNSYWTAMIYIDNRHYYPLQLILRGILTMNRIDPELITDYDDVVRQQNMTELMKYSLIIISSAPLIIVYPFIQKYFEKGVMIGSIKA